MSTSKFYYYNIWVEKKDGDRLKIDNAFDNETFTESNYQIDSTEDKHYFTQFQQIGSNSFHGALMRAKSEEGFVRMNERRELGILADETSDEGQTGALDRDFVNYGVRVSEKNIDVLLEVGYQTPGILTIKKYLHQHLDVDNAYKIGHESRMPNLDEEKLDNLLSLPLKKAEISFKKDPKNVVGIDGEDTLSKLGPNNYRVKIETSLEAGAEDAASIGSYLTNYFPLLSNSDESDLVDNIKQIDFPSIMNTFRVQGIEEDTEEEIEENLAETMDIEEIDMTGYRLFDEDLGEKLIRKIDRKH